MRAIRAVKLHTHEAARESGWRNHYAEVISASYRSGMYGIRLNLAEAVLFNGQFLILVFLGASAVMAQELTIGLLLAFLAYRTSFVNSASALIDQIQQWRLVGVHLDRLSDIVVQTPEPLVITPREELLPGPEVRGQGLTFRYDPGDPPIFEDLNFTIPAGSMVAIVGPSRARPLSCAWCWASSRPARASCWSMASA
jgi:ATP-binding cassette subfamily B protein RaxB